jgi:phosphatidylserine/phosphatidylglycerophosphate/cardiolipin synthase-like enzyme
MLKPPLDRAALVGFGLRHQLEAIEYALAGHKSAACLAVLDVALAEREDRKPTPELVWTGPEAPAGTARDTAVVLRELFEGARESVILAGYDFTYARDLLAPLHRSMQARGVDARFFVHVKQVTHGDDPEHHLEVQLGGFVAKCWTFGKPRPRIYYDKRALVPGPPYSSLHAKCVVVDGARAFVSSANFTQRAQERNIEVGVLIDDASFATFLAGQWLGLIEAGIVGEFVRPLVAG